GLMLDLRIRNATGNLQSLDDVMRLLYREYYQRLQRGFTEAEFQRACEQVAGVPLGELFEYVYTTKDIDYQQYLGYAGLKLRMNKPDQAEGKSRTTFSLIRVPDPDNSQSALLTSWQQE
ncbi:MAG: hypothetical protein ACWGNV_13320, partial [Bacteroidales bacterium]